MLVVMKKGSSEEKIQAAVNAIEKRGMAAMLQEWLMVAEYIMEQGNNNVIHKIIEQD